MVQWEGTQVTIKFHKQSLRKIETYVPFKLYLRSFDLPTAASLPSEQLLHQRASFEFAEQFRGYAWKDAPEKWEN